MTGGLRPGALWVLAARTGQGKTALASTVAEAVAFDQRRPALFVSLEMENAEVVQRTLGRRGRVQASRIRDHRLSPGERDDLLEAHAAIGKDAPLWLCDHESCTVADISGLARRHKRQHGLDLLVVDYLQLIETDNPKDTRQEQVARICRRLKKLARQLQVPVLVLAQLNREADKGDAKPRLSHLRESGAIEQDADVVLLLQRFDSDDLRGTANLAVAKARNGAVGDVPLKWEPEFISYLPAEADEQPVDWIEQQTMCGSF